MGPYWALLEPPWAVLEACWDMLAAWMALLNRFGAFGEPQGGSMAAQGPPGVGVVFARVCGSEAGGPLRKRHKPCQTALGIPPRLNVPGGTVADSGIIDGCSGSGCPASLCDERTALSIPQHCRPIVRPGEITRRSTVRNRDSTGAPAITIQLPAASPATVPAQHFGWRLFE